MSAGSPGEDSGGEPAQAQNPWSHPADFGQPGSPATPQTPEPAGFSSAAPQDWSASTPASWSAPEPAPTAPQNPPTQSAPASQPTQPLPPGPSAFTPPPWPGSPDTSASQHSAGNGFGQPGSDPWTGQPPGHSQPAGLYGPPAAAYYTPVTGRTNRLAIAALVCGIAQFLFGLFALNFLLAIPAIICGALGMRQTRQRGEGGRGLAIAGLVLGILGIVWNVLYVVLIVALGTHFAPGGPSPSTP